LESWDLSRDARVIIEFNGEFLNERVLLRDDLLESFYLLSEELNLTLKSWYLFGNTIELVDLEVQSLDLLFVRGDLATHEFDLLSKVNEFLFKELFFAGCGIKLAQVFGFLDTFVIECAIEFFELLDEKGVVTLRLSKLRFERFKVEGECLDIDVELIDGLVKSGNFLIFLLDGLLKSL
jgi:hypothetical protein